MSNLSKNSPNDRVVFSRDNTMKGVVISERRCLMDGCGGTCLGVRWEDKKLTWPCTKGMTKQNDGWHIR